MRASIGLRGSDTLKFWWKQGKYRWREMRWASLSPGSSLVFTVQPGLKIKLYADSQLCRLIYYRDFESVERAFVNRFLQPGDTFIDVGANIGLFTLIAAMRVGPKGRVVAFEPAATTYRRLVENVQLNGLQHVMCLNLALSDNHGALNLIQSVDGFDAWNSLVKPTMGESFIKERVELVSWDKYAARHGLIGSVTMMKIDVEGWEKRVLVGGNEIFTRADAPVLQVEFADASAIAAHTSCHALYRCLESLGYQMFTYDPEIHGLRAESLRDAYPYVNLIATKQPDFVNARLRTGH